MTRIAVIDLGTNTFHLLVAEVGTTTMEILHKEKTSVKIGEQGISKGIISEAAADRALNTLKSFSQTMEHYKVEKSMACATSAFRNASNGRILAKKIREETGIDITIISGEQEALYIYKGVRQALDLGAANSLIMDIGGGSLEFIIANEQEIRWKESYEIGAQRLVDYYPYHDPIIPEEIDKLEGLLDSRLTTLVTAMEQYNPKVLIGSSGTFDTLSEIYTIRQGLKNEPQSERPLSVEGYLEIHHEIISYTREQRMSMPGMIEMRVDMIVVASCLIHYLLKRFAMDQIRVSSYALKEGVLEDVVRQIRDQDPKRT